MAILNWNNADDTISCVAALLAASPPPERIVIVDNGSADNSLSRIRDWLNFLQSQSEPASAPVHLVAANRNLGFAGGTNRGLEWLMNETDVSHLLILNNDATVSKSFFADVSEAVAAVGVDSVIGPTVFEDPERDKVWYAGGVEIPYRALVEHTVVQPRSTAPRPTDFVSGCAMIVSRGVIEKIGGLADIFFPAYFEDGDFCHRARRAGFKVMYAPKPSAYHKVGSTVRAAKLETLLAYSKSRLRVIYVRRNYSGAMKLAALTYLGVTKPARFVADILRGRPDEAWAILSGTSSGFFARDVRDA
ncbi:MAG TPA: glycosyltransferase family 2 protein [Gemmatimonadaceae bacterium]|nr:glycosyltransferase family 2 protein [Gemmatimonadaceae bacterium]